MTALSKSVILMLLFGAAAATASRLTPRVALAPSDASLERMIPLRFGAWMAEAQPADQVVIALQKAAYDEVLMRTYRREDGARVMVALAYGRRQTQEFKIHRPELCYYAQGYDVTPLGKHALRLPDSRQVESVALLTRSRARTEIVNYWIRVGDRIVNNAWDARWLIFRHGLAGDIPDGLLVRTSSFAHSPAELDHESAVQQSFLSDLYGAVPAGTRRFLVGG